MELVRVRHDDSPDHHGFIRLTGEIRYERQDGRPHEELWFEFPAQYGSDLSTSGDPWLACLLPLAMTLGEPLAVAAPVDPLLLTNAHDLVAVWQAWYPSRRAVRIEADTSTDAPGPQGPRRTVSFFSGGIDSFFTALRPRALTAPDDLLFVHGLPDLPLHRSEQFAHVEARLREAATALGRELIVAKTNMLSTRMATADWGRLAMSPATLSVAFAIERRFGRVLIPSSLDCTGLEAWGSHPMTDPLLSTTRTAVAADGFAFSRAEKTALVSQSAVAMRALRVCLAKDVEWNCTGCEKCYRTLLALDALGALDRASTFDLRRYDVRHGADVYLADALHRSFFHEIERLARARGRRDIERAVRTSLRRSRRLERIRRLYAWVGRKPLVGPAIRRLGPRVHARILASSIPPSVLASSSDAPSLPH
jgi:hypothetical protein